jgi:hypothetical protein
MRWQIHALIRALLEPVPVRLRRRLQDIRGRSRLDLEEIYPRKLRFLRRIRAQGLPVEGRSFLEIGTGWHPVLPVLLSLSGAERVVGTDLNPWLNLRSLTETLRAMSGIADRIAADLELPAAECRHRLEQLAARCEAPGASTDEVLAEAGLSYEAPLDATRTGYADHGFDYIFSSNVLEHVPPPVIEGIFRESRRILKPSGMHLHHVNPGDHFTLIDPRLSSVNFLKFSPAAWRLIGGWGAGYHNRLRCAEFGRMLADSGFQVVYEEADVDARALEALTSRKVRPHSCFDGFTAEELACSVVDVFARRLESEGVDQPV